MLSDEITAIDQGKRHIASAPRATDGDVLLGARAARNQLNFVALDFETANGYRDSACAVGLAVVRNGVLLPRLSRFSFLNPKTRYFTNTDIHGITYEDVKCAPTFIELWGSRCTPGHSARTPRSPLGRRSMRAGCALGPPRREVFRAILLMSVSRLR